ncbi:MAG TPA: carboxypeptidase regulatory-like domain-containing protein [Pyrinomonadaceae bacterium]|nr:carboxypeptidase regulatory-like domain-containing protein [Pyrinomonadaceae bacterium]
MMFPTRPALACILMILGVAVCSHAQTTSPAEPLASISGTVKFKGEPVQGVNVTLRSNDGTASSKLTNYRGVTDAKGQYRIADVPPGRYLVTPAATAFVTDDASVGERTLIVSKGETIEDIDFSLIRGGVITGKVLDADGRPVIEEDVYVFSPRDPGLGAFRPATVTDDRGVYRIFALKPGDYTVAAGRNDILGNSGRRPSGNLFVRTYYPGVTQAAQAKRIEVSDGSEATNVDIVISRSLTPHTASGLIVIGETGQPLSNVPVSVTHIVGPNATMISSRGVVTNDQGEFKLENLTAGQYSVSVQSMGNSDWRADDQRFEIVDRDVTGLVVKTIKGGSVSGVVVLEGTDDSTVRKHLSNAMVLVWVARESTRNTGTPGVASKVRPDGSFSVKGLATGNATLSIGAAVRLPVIRIERNGVIQLGGMDIRQGEDITGLRIVVGFGDASIRGTIEIENGATPPNGRLFVWSRRLNSASYGLSAAQIDARGQFVIDNLFPGTYELTAGVMVQDSRVPFAPKKQEVVVTAGSTTNTIIKLDLSPPKP